MCADLSRTPRTLLVRDRSSFLEERSRLETQVEQQHFNYKVSLLLPQCTSCPSHLDSVLDSMSSFYLVKNMPAYKLLDENFLKAAVYPGGVYALSYGTRIDEDNCVALLPNGHLHLSLDKDSFELLGVEGKPSKFNYRTSRRFVVSVDLTDVTMTPGRAGYLRLLTGLKSRLQLQTDFLLSHHPGGGATLKTFLSDCDWSEHRPEINRRCLMDLSCPTLPSCDPHSVLEWLGAVEADVCCDNSSSSFLSTLTCPEPATRLSNALRISTVGLLLPHDIKRLIDQLRHHLEQPGSESWVSLTVHGFVDSPVSWGENEHGFLRGGENFYTLLMFKDLSYHLYLATGAQDACPP